MIFQAYQTFQEYNQTGISALFLYPSQIAILNIYFIPLILFGFFMIALLASYFTSKRLGSSGGNFLGCFAAAAYTTNILAITMSLVEGLINTPTMVTCFVVSVIATILLFISD